MKYLIALFFPALAFLMCGKWVQALIALVLQVTILGWLPATIWAFLVINSHHADKRADRLERAIRDSVSTKTARAKGRRG